MHLLLHAGRMYMHHGPWGFFEMDGLAIEKYALRDQRFFFWFLWKFNELLIFFEIFFKCSLQLSEADLYRVSKKNTNKTKQ